MAHFPDSFIQCISKFSIIGNLRMPNAAPGPRNTVGMQLSENPHPSRTRKTDWISNRVAMERSVGTSRGREPGREGVRGGRQPAWAARMPDTTQQLWEGHYKHLCLNLLICKMGLTVLLRGPSELTRKRWK